MELHPQNFRKGLGCFATGVTIVVVTHELESAFRIADRITVLDRQTQRTIELELHGRSRF